MGRGADPTVLVDGMIRGRFEAAWRLMAPGKDRLQRRASRLRLRGMAVDRVQHDLARMGGLPTIRDTRVTVGMVLGQLAAGRTTEEVLADYPYLDPDDVLGALEYAALAVNEQEVPVARPA